MSNLQSLYDELLTEKLPVVVLSGNFNSRSALFWGESKTETAERKKCSDFMVTNDLDQLINELTHIQARSSPTCVDLILTNNPSSFVKGVGGPRPKCGFS